MQIGPFVVQEANQLTVEVPIVLDSGEGRLLWFALAPPHASFVSPRLDAALLALLIPAMSSGENIHVEGDVSADLLFNVNGPVQVVLASLMPGLHRIWVTADNAMAPDRGLGKRGVATGFSAGIDSFCVLADRFYAQDVPDTLRISHLTFNNVGSHGPGDGGRALFRERLDRVRPVAESIGLPLVAVDTNMDEFYPREAGFQLTHSMRNASVGFLLQQGIRRLLYASAYPFDLIAVGPADSMGFIDPVLLPIISTESFVVEAVGTEYRRTEKTLRLASIEDSWRTLNVCVNSDAKGANCSTCWKCLRTLLTLEIGGVLDLYAEAFDLEQYGRVRDQYLIQVSYTEDPFQRDIVQMGVDRGFTFPKGGPLHRYLYRNAAKTRSIRSRANSRLRPLRNWL